MQFIHPDWNDEASRRKSKVVCRSHLYHHYQMDRMDGWMDGWMRPFV